MEDGVSDGDVRSFMSHLGRLPRFSRDRNENSVIYTERNPDWQKIERLYRTCSKQTISLVLLLFMQLRTGKKNVAAIANWKRINQQSLASLSAISKHGIFQDARVKEELTRIGISPGNSSSSSSSSSSFSSSSSSSSTSSSSSSSSFESKLEEVRKGLSELSSGSTTTTHSQIGLYHYSFLYYLQRLQEFAAKDEKKDLALWVEKIAEEKEKKLGPARQKRLEEGKLREKIHREKQERDKRIVLEEAGYYYRGDAYRERVVAAETVAKQGDEEFQQKENDKEEKERLKEEEEFSKSVVGPEEEKHIRRQELVYGSSEDERYLVFYFRQMARRIVEQYQALESYFEKQFHNVSDALHDAMVNCLAETLKDSLEATEQAMAGYQETYIADRAQVQEIEAESLRRWKTLWNKWRVGMKGWLEQLTVQQLSVVRMLEYHVECHRKRATARRGGEGGGGARKEEQDQKDQKDQNLKEYEDAVRLLQLVQKNARDVQTIAKRILSVNFNANSNSTSPLNDTLILLYRKWCTLTVDNVHVAQIIHRRTVQSQTLRLTLEGDYIRLKREHGVLEGHLNDLRFQMDQILRETWEKKKIGSESGPNLNQLRTLHSKLRPQVSQKAQELTNILIELKAVQTRERLASIQIPSFADLEKLLQTQDLLEKKEKKATQEVSLRLREIQKTYELNNEWLYNTETEKISRYLQSLFDDRFDIEWKRWREFEEVLETAGIEIAKDERFCLSEFSHVQIQEGKEIFKLMQVQGWEHYLIRYVRARFEQNKKHLQTLWKELQITCDVFYSKLLQPLHHQPLGLGQYKQEQKPGWNGEEKATTTFQPQTAFFSSYSPPPSSTSTTTTSSSYSLFPSSSSSSLYLGGSFAAG